MKPAGMIFKLAGLAMLAGGWVELAAATNAPPALEVSAAPAAASVFRVIGSLCLVFALFFGGVWLFRNRSRLNAGRGAARKLQLVEAKSLGGRQAVFVVGYEKQRFLVGSTPQGLSLLAHLPENEEEPAGESGRIVPVPFTEALMTALGRR